MKKKLALGLAGIMIIASITGCGKSSSEYLLDINYSKYVELCEYKGVEATKIVYDVTDEEVQEEIESRMDEYATYDPITDRGVELGDYALISYTATIDGEVVDACSGEDEDILVGEGYIYPELEDALIGMKTGESKTVEVELTEEYVDEEYVGKTASVEVTLTEITVEVLPEYNLEYVEEYTDFDTMEAYEEYIKEELEDYKKYEYEYVATDEIMTYLLENSKFDGYPDELYDQCEATYNSGNEYYASMYNMTVEEYLDMFGIDEETKKAEIEDSIKYELIIGAIAQNEGVDCTEEEIQEYANTYYEDYEYESAEEFLGDYTTEEIGYEVIYEKVIEFLYENATFKEKPEEEYLEEQEALFYQ